MVTEFVEELLQAIWSVPALTSPWTFAALTGVAFAFLWFAVAPSGADVAEESRLRGYLRGRGDIVEDAEFARSFLRRALAPALRNFLKTLGSLTPIQDVQRVQQRLSEADNPGGLTVPDILGLQILLMVFLGGGYLAITYLMGNLGTTAPLTLARNGGLLALLGFLAPRLWLRSRADARKREIVRRFSDALDLLSVSVDAGLALDSAMVRVCERWDNALTEELNRVVREIRVGTPRNVALQRMAERTGVPELSTFVGVLIQSSELGVSIAHTLHTQAAQVRLRRRQRAEELAHQASVKMVFALVFLIFPALLVVLLGPGVPRIFEALGTMGG